ncbi:hypothetical protein MMC34_008696, partial [Xylographa carneopallida]|nr:hypothetical protein [Xylographa carneopallida]
HSHLTRRASRQQPPLCHPTNTEYSATERCNRRAAAGSLRRRHAPASLSAASRSARRRRQHSQRQTVEHGFDLLRTAAGVDCGRPRRARTPRSLRPAHRRQRRALSVRLRSALALVVAAPRLVPALHAPRVVPVLPFRVRDVGRAGDAGPRRAVIHPRAVIQRQQHRAAAVHAVQAGRPAGRLRAAAAGAARHHAQLARAARRAGRRHRAAPDAALAAPVQQRRHQRGRGDAGGRDEAAGRPTALHRLCVARARRQPHRCAGRGRAVGRSRRAAASHGHGRGGDRHGHAAVRCAAGVVRVEGGERAHVAARAAAAERAVVPDAAHADCVRHLACCCGEPHGAQAADGVQSAVAEGEARAGGRCETAGGSGGGQRM